MLAGFFSTIAKAAVPAFRPTDPSQIVLRLSDSNSEALLTRLRQASHEAPTDIDALLRYVNALLTVGAKTGNERYYGYAEQAVAGAPESLRSSVALLRAQLLQHRHDFRDAEHALNEILEHDPRQREALLMRAQVRLHLHEPENALRDCTRLALVVDLLTSTTCIAQARAAMSPDLVDTERAYALVTTLLQTAGGSNSSRSWSAGVAAELAARLGNEDAAATWYRTAFELDRDSHYVRITYADWLLARGRYREAHDVAGSGASNADALRVVLASQARDSADSRQLQLAWREASARGERTHLRDQARFELIVLHDTARAHVTALDNFFDHREAEDALLLAQTAAAQNDAKAKNLIRQWQTERRYADRRLDELLAKRP
jgi:Tfp pilus assembly protein PilF